MKKFVAVYMGSLPGAATQEWESLDPAARAKREAAGMARWMSWGNEHASHIVENGGPLGKTKRIGLAGISDIKNRITGYTIVQAESHDDAAKFFLNHPHFSIFPGDSVEVMECLPIPER